MTARYAITIWMLMMLASSQAANLTLAWDPNPEANLAGYKVHYGGSSRAYTNVIDVGLVTIRTVSNLLADATYFFALTAYNDLGAESAYSDELVHQFTVIVTNRIAAPTNLRVLSNSTTTISLSWDAPITTNSIVGYRAYFGLTTNRVAFQITTSTNITLTNLVAGTNYFISVAAIGPALEHGEFTQPVAALTFPSISPPRNLRIVTNSLQSAISLDGPWITVASFWVEIPTNMPNRFYRASLEGF